MEQLPHGQCPNCRCPLQYFPDIKTNREIESLLVYCHHKMSGCKWQGELREIEKHDGRCGYKKVNCYDCNKSMHRSNLKVHKEKECKQRKYRCLKCNEEGKYCYITSQKHTDVCPGVIVGCPNNGCDKKVKRGELAAHRGVCPQEVVTCTYHNIGCNERMKRKDITEHEDSSMGLHLSMAVKRIEEKTCKSTWEHCMPVYDPSSHTQAAPMQPPFPSNHIQEAPMQPPFLSNHIQEAPMQPPFLSNHIHVQEAPMQPPFPSKREIAFTMKNFQNLKDTNTPWYSPGFYTSSGGYKMSLLVCPNGNGTGKGTHLSCFTCLMPGEYDATLEWPFRGVVTVELLNQEEDNNHHSMTIVYEENNFFCSRVTEKPHGSGLGNPKFLSHTDLYNSPIAVNSPIVYIKNDTLYFRITVANKNKTKPWLAVAL